MGRKGLAAAFDFVFKPPHLLINAESETLLQIIFTLGDTRKTSSFDGLFHSGTKEVVNVWFTVRLSEWEDYKAVA